MTPMMRQYMEAKRACPDALLLFRMGDFYELFYDDAKIAAQTLNLTLTSRDKGDNAPPMAGFPHHQLESYLAKLLAAGFRVAVCDQVEDPKMAKGLVRREITRIVTAGTITDEALLDPKEPNYLAAIVPQDPAGMAWIDLSTGRFFAGVFPLNQLVDELVRLSPAEVLWPDDAATAPPNIDGMVVTKRPVWVFASAHTQPVLERQFGPQALEGFGFDAQGVDAVALSAAGAILDYLNETQRTSLSHIERLFRYQVGTFMEIDESTWKSLEITRTLRDGSREGSLLWVIDRTITGMGGRLLVDWLANPLTDRKAILQRQDAVMELMNDPRVCDQVRRTLGKVHDLERLLGRITTGRCTPRDLASVAKTLRQIPELKQSLASCFSGRLAEIATSLDPFPTLEAKLSAALIEQCPLSATEGGFIREGYSAELDELKQLAHGGKQWIAEYQAREAQRTGIPSLKVGYNKVFGYYIEVTNTHRDKVPPDYFRKQTLKNAERYITPELKEYEEKVLSADEQAKQLEYQIFVELRDFLLQFRRPLQQTANFLAELDVLAGWAELARDRNYCRPELSEEPILEITDGRHPVLDITQPEGTFVPNDAWCGPDGFIILITGPNMAGKSTYIRQTALITLLAQIGCLVPARSAKIGIADRLFARVGASDELARGRSTFMVEMIETARILNSATKQSLVILDEIGRGTSTYDGMSLAWAVVEYLHNRIKCRTFFATHYHELTELAEVLPGVKNFNVAVREWQDQVVFLHKIVPGAADKSYGIHVAQLAGIPRAVIDRARHILEELETSHLEGRNPFRQSAKERSNEDGRPIQLTLFEPIDHPLMEEIREIDLTRITPLEAFEKLRKWQEQLTFRPRRPRGRRSI
ncbi:MAG: DNA mismatch repair protein MutS [Thermogutta sp.]